MTDQPDYEKLLKAAVFAAGRAEGANGTYKVFLPGSFYHGHADNFVLSVGEFRNDPAGIELVIMPIPVAAANKEREDLVEKFATYIRKNVMVSDDYSKRIAKALVELADKEGN